MILNTVIFIIQTLIIGLLKSAKKRNLMGVEWKELLWRNPMGRWISEAQRIERRERVAVLKAQGLPHSKIAMRMGITMGTSERDYKQYKKEMNL